VPAPISKPVRRRSQTIDSVVRQRDPKKKEDTTYRFSNGRKFTERENKNPYV
jgi:hypothetical protein